jgi:hypothetical protein
MWGSAGRTFTTVSNNSTGRAPSLALDETNNRIFVAGTIVYAATGKAFCGTTSIGSTNDAFLFSLDSSGNVLNCNLEGAASGDVQGWGVAVDSTGRPYLSGNTNQNLNSVNKTGTVDLFLIKYSNDFSSCGPSGSPPCNTGLTRKWTYLNGTAAKNVEGRYMKLDNDKNAYISFRADGSVNSETYNSTSPTRDMGFLKFNASSTGTASSYSITGITRANPAVVTATAHGFSNGDIVYISGVVGMTQVNGGYYKVANAAANTFELQSKDGININSSSFTAYASGGTAGGLVLAKQVGSTQNAVNAATQTDIRGMCLDPVGGNVYVTEFFQPNTSGVAAANTKGIDGQEWLAGEGSVNAKADAVITQWTTSGTKLTTLESGVSNGATGADTFYIKCAVDGAGNVYTAGSTTGNLDGVSLTAGTPNNSIRDALTTRFEPDSTDSYKIKKK